LGQANGSLTVPSVKSIDAGIAPADGKLVSEEDHQNGKTKNGNRGASQLESQERKS
jgi:hypothetical protein